MHYQFDPVQTTNTSVHSAINMLGLAEMVLKLVGGKSRLVYMPLPADDPKQRQPDITLAKASLGWTPKVALEDGLKETIAYFRKLLADA